MKMGLSGTRKLLSVLLIFLLASSFALAGCSSNSSNNATAPKTKDGKTSFVMWTFVKEHADFWKDAAATWNKSHPKQQIALQISVLPYDQMHQKLQVALNSGKGAPDIVDVEIGKFANYTKNPNNVPFLDLTKEVQPYLPNLVKSRVDNYTVAGKIYGLDYHVGTTVAYYNMDIMKQAGIDPASIKTWQDFVNAGKVVKAKTGKYMTSVETGASFVWDSMVSQQHADFLKDGKANLNTPQSLNALHLLQDMLYKDKIAKLAEGGHQDNEQYYAAFNKGEYASVVMPEWYMGRMTDYMPNLKGKIQIEPLPIFNQGDYRSAGLGGTATVVTIQAHDQQLAKDFIVASKATPEGSTKTWTILGFDPIRSDVWTTPAMQADNKYTEYFGKNIFNEISVLKNEIGTLSFTNNAAPIILDEFMTNGLPKIMQKDANIESTIQAVDTNANKRLDAGK